MSPESWPTEAERRAWVAGLVRDIDERHARRRRGLLTELMRTAWPSWLGQDQ